MQRSTTHASASRLCRIGYCLLPLMIGTGAALMLLILAGGPTRQAYAGTLTFPGCASTIQGCIDLASPGDTILIQAGDYTESLTLTKAVSLTGALSSTTILHALPNTRVLTVTGLAVDRSVVISGLTFTGGMVTGTTNCPQSCGGGLLITNQANPRLASLFVVGNAAGYSGGGLYDDAGASMAEVHFISNTAGYDGGGAWTSDATTVLDGLFEGNQVLDALAGGPGGGLYVIGALALTDTEFISNTGGGAYVNGVTTVQGGLFQGNQCTGINCRAGGLSVFGKLVLTDTRFFNNTGVFGGGASVDRAASVQGGLFQGNQCSSFCAGGGLYAGWTLMLTGTQFISNTSGVSGGGAYADNGILRDALFQSNKCTAVQCYGGGLYGSDTYGSLTLINTDFLSNSATSSGGGFDADGPGSATLQGGLFEGNFVTGTASTGGGVSAYVALGVTGTVFIGNHAQGKGGAIWQQYGGPSRVVNALFASNSAGSEGDAMFLSMPGSTTILYTTIASPTPGLGAAIVISNGIVGITDTIISNYAVGISLTAGSAYEDYNLFFGVPVTATAGVTNGGHSLIGDPAFRDPAHDDYHLTAASAARGKGIDVGVNTDFEGGPRPIGGVFDIGFDQFLRKLFLSLVRR